MRRGPVFAATVLIGLGVFFLLRNTGVITDTVSVWPILLLAVGLWLLFMRMTSWWWESGGYVVPMVLVALGGYFLLRDLGAVDQDVSVWPILLIAVGVGVLLEAIPRRSSAPLTETIEVPLDGARRGRVRIEHGAGRLRVGGSAPTGLLVRGTAAGPIEQDVRRGGEEVEARLRRAWQRGIGKHGRGDWTLTLSGEVPVALELRTGADESTVDLTDVQVTELVLRTGASKTDLVLPSKGRMTATISAGAAGMSIRIPDGMAARIHKRIEMAGFEIDTSRFVPTADGYESASFDDAEHRVELTIEGGAASFRIT